MALVEAGTGIRSYQILSVVMCTLPPHSRLSFPIMSNEQGESDSLLRSGECGFGLMELSCQKRNPVLHVLLLRPWQ